MTIAKRDSDEEFWGCVAVGQSRTRHGDPEAARAVDVGEVSKQCLVSEWRFKKALRSGLLVKDL